MVIFNRFLQSLRKYQTALEKAKNHRKKLTEGAFPGKIPFGIESAKIIAA